MIVLVITFLLGLYVLKFFMPEQFVMAIENEHLVMFGGFVDSHLWFHIVLACITSFITYWLYVCAVTHKWRLNWKELVAVLIIIAITQVLYSFDETYDLAGGIAFIAMFILPIIDGANHKDVAIVFSTHYISQLLSTQIRNLPLLLTNVNYITIFLMTVECYFWLLLFYLYFNIKEKK